MTFGYNARLVGSTSTKVITEQAVALLQELESKRSSVDMSHLFERLPLIMMNILGTSKTHSLHRSQVFQLFYIKYVIAGCLINLLCSMGGIVIKKVRLFVLAIIL